MTRRLILMIITSTLLAFGFIWLAGGRFAPPANPIVRSLTEQEPTTTLHQVLPLSRPSLTISTNALSTGPSSTASPALSAIPSSVPQDWKTLKVAEYGFQLSYPPGWSSVKNVTNVTGNPYPVVYSEDIVSARPDASGETLIVPLVVAVYNAPTGSISQWLTNVYGLDVTALKRGSIDIVLSNAYDGTLGSLYNESKEDDLYYYGVGSSGPGGLIYSTYITRSSSQYVYLIQIRFPLGNSDFVGEGASQPDQYDKYFVETYKQIISSFTYSN
jgi:hypothetical protein